MSLGYFNSGAGGARAGAALCVVPCVSVCASVDQDGPESQAAQRTAGAG